MFNLDAIVEYFRWLILGPQDQSQYIPIKVEKEQEEEWRRYRR